MSSKFLNANTNVNLGTADDEVPSQNAVKTYVDNTVSNKVDKNDAITGATHSKITYDSKGLVTSGADLTASDIPDLSGTYYLATNPDNYITSSDIMYEAVYGTTTFEDIVSAVNANKIVYCDYSNKRYYWVNGSSTSTYQYLQNYSTNTSASYIRVNQSNTWSTSSKTVFTTSSLIGTTSTTASSNSNVYTALKMDNLLSAKQDSLSQGEGITISNNTVSTNNIVWRQW